MCSALPETPAPTQTRQTELPRRAGNLCQRIDNCVHVTRSSYGTPDDVAWMPGMTAGKSCIVDFEGTVLADAGARVGLASHTVDLDRPRVKERSFGGDVGDATTDQVVAGLVPRF